MVGGVRGHYGSDAGFRGRGLKRPLTGARGELKRGEADSNRGELKRGEADLRARAARGPRA